MGGFITLLSQVWRAFCLGDPACKPGQPTCFS